MMERGRAVSPAGSGMDLEEEKEEQEEEEGEEAPGFLKKVQCVRRTSLTREMQKTRKPVHVRKQQKMKSGGSSSAAQWCLGEKESRWVMLGGQ